MPKDAFTISPKAERKQSLLSSIHSGFLLVAAQPGWSRLVYTHETFWIFPHICWVSQFNQLSLKIPKTHWNLYTRNATKATEAKQGKEVADIDRKLFFCKGMLYPHCWRAWDFRKSVWYSVIIISIWFQFCYLSHEKNLFQFYFEHQSMGKYINILFWAVKS